MHYYTFNIADYRKDTTHLSIVEHGIYRQLLDIYYLDEGPLPDKAKLMRLVCVRTADEERALDNVLSDFFEVTKNGYENKRCNKGLEDIFSKSEKARQSAKARWKNKTQQNQEDTEGDMRTHSEGNADGMLPNTQYPIPNTQKEKKDVDSNESPKPNKWTEEDLKTANRMLEKIQDVAPSQKGGKNWPDVIRLMRERDNRTHEEIWEMFKFANEHYQFWRANILSPGTLRKQWVRLEAERNKNVRPKKEYIGPDVFGF